MTHTPRISVLIPIYNCAEYLRECLDSVTKQTISGLEIICINDGSTDQSREIIQEYAKQDSRIAIIDKPNTGYGDSMNQGIKHATGEYVGIVEPDDWISYDGFKKLYDVAKKFRADVVKANHFSFYHTKSRKLVEHKTRYIQVKSAETVYPKDDHAIFSYPPAIWAAIYRRKFLLQHDISFLPTPGASYQDIGFNFKVWLNNPKTAITPEAFLHYRLDNAGSSVKQFNKVRCAIDEYDELWRYVKQHHLNHVFATALVASQFRNYLWNLQRLPGRPAREFYYDLCSMLRKANDQEQLNQEDFSRRHWRLAQAILKYPRTTYHLIRLRVRLHY